MDRGRPDDSRRAHDDYSHPARLRTTWDGLAIADAPPFGAIVVVCRVGRGWTRNSAAAWSGPPVAHPTKL
jgi:hypothetical protein